MARQPFVWEIHVLHEVVEDEIAQLRELPYSMWQEIVDAPMTKTVTARDSKPYKLTLEATWMRPSSENIRVAVTLKGSGWRGPTITESFVITPENKFL